MENIILNNLVLLILLLVTPLKKYFFSYSSEKGKNLATKEDIGDITKKIESVKTEYSESLAVTRAELSSQINTHSFRYEKEYEILNLLTIRLINLYNSTVSLRPAFDIINPNESYKERKEKRLKKFYRDINKLNYIKEIKRPFYCESIYNQIIKIMTLCNDEKCEYEIIRNPTSHKNYWTKAQENREKIIDETNLALLKIRERVVSWENLNQKK